MDCFTVGPGEEGRLDRFILVKKPELGTGVLHRYLRENKIKLNGKKRPLNTPVRAGDEVRLYLPTTAGKRAGGPEILYEDGGLLALNKPAGQRCQNEGGGQAGTLLGDARRYLGENGGFEVALCHRLDTGTSGVILVAKRADVLDFVGGLLLERRLEKTYVGLAVGHPKPAEGALAGWLLKDVQRAQVRVLPGRAPGAKPVRLRYRTEAASGRLALLRIWPETGRTHQIRAQLAAAGTPLLGDSKYGRQDINRELRCRYQCLCAEKLVFPELAGGAFAHYGGLEIACPAPWFYGQALEGTLK